MTAETDKSAPVLLNREEAAAFLRISPWSLHQFVHRHRDENPLPTRRVGRRDVFLSDELIAWTAEEAARTDRSRAKRRARRAARGRFRKGCADD